MKYKLCGSYVIDYIFNIVDIIKKIIFYNIIINVEGGEIECLWIIQKITQQAIFLKS